MIEHQNGILHIDGIPATELAELYGTPLYVYSQQQLELNCQVYSELETNLDLSVYYAVKANNNISLLGQILNSGLGFDIVSGGELLCCLKTGVDPKNIVYSGVGKSVSEIRLAIEAAIGCINVESFAELDRINDLAQEMQLSVPVALRINPHIDAKTHPAISTALIDSKFGIEHNQALKALSKASKMNALNIKGIVCHIGSQIQTLEPYDQACDSMISIHDAMYKEGVKIEHLGLGGGIGVDYRGDTQMPDPGQLVRLVESRLKDRGLSLSLEPGRSIIANAGITLTRIEYIKSGATKFAIVDAAMNDLPRPSIYDAWHRIQEVNSNSNAEHLDYCVAGPVCESTDIIGKNRKLAIEQGDLLAVFDTGAYSSVMASNYNCRPRAASVLISDGKPLIISKRENLNELFY